MSEFPPPRRPEPAAQMPVRQMLGLQLGIVLLALVLGMIFRIDLLADLEISLAALNLSGAGTATLLLGVWTLNTRRWGWVVELKTFMRETLVPLFRHAPPGTLFLVALLAGVGEELLFRGVIQGGLDGVLGPWPALVLASILFGAMHALSKAYFVLATVMGFYMGLIYLWTGNLLIPILIHFLYDWIVLRYYVDAHENA
ncbi:MAG: CPBP family intramembrane glutamic endopeptidase [Wenzhouxiangella sp.]|nr:CPBP family intramembrane glutamic endopeptidase [Wenzhouxiangella sp.]